LRTLAGAAAAALVTGATLLLLPSAGVPGTVMALAAGGATAVPFIWRELRLLMNL
jgi:hypothetical protein